LKGKKENEEGGGIKGKETQFRQSAGWQKRGLKTANDRVEQKVGPAPLRWVYREDPKAAVNLAEERGNPTDDGVEAEGGPFPNEKNNQNQKKGSSRGA